MSAEEDYDDDVDVDVAPADDGETGDDADITIDDDGEEDEDDSEEEESAPKGRPSARQRGVPSKKTFAVRRITQVELATGRAELKAIGADVPYERPKTRGDCQWCPVCQLVRDAKSSGLDRAAFRALGSDPSDREHPKKKRASGSDALPSTRGTSSSEMGRFACGHLEIEVIWRSRPCVFVSCKQSLFLDTSETGSIILNFPHLDPGDMPPEQSCALDLAQKGPMTLEDIAAVTNLTRERIRQVELKALVRRARPAAVAMGLGPEDAAAMGTRHNVGPGADLEEAGIEGAVPSDIATILSSGGGEDS